MPSPKRNFAFLNGCRLDELAVLVSFSECNYLPQTEEEVGVDTTNIPEMIPLGQRVRGMPHYK